MNFSALKVFRAKEKRDEVIQAITSMASLAVDAIEIFFALLASICRCRGGENRFRAPALGLATVTFLVLLLRAA
jgi:hypothetical protein